MSIRPTRRAVLGGSAAALLTACTRSRHSSAPPVDPDIALTAAAVAREQALLTGYDRMLSSAGLSAALRARLAPLRAEHAVHLQALSAAGMPPPSPAAPTSPSPSASATASVPVPATVAQLVALERRSAAAHGEDCLLASRRLAPVLASLAASETTHVGALT